MRAFTWLAVVCACVVRQAVLRDARRLADAAPSQTVVHEPQSIARQGPGTKSELKHRTVADIAWLYELVLFEVRSPYVCVCVGGWGTWVGACARTVTQNDG